jgi:DNA-binding NtrC family response regulator
VLIRDILAQLSDEMGLLKPIEADPKTVARLSEYSWPGNVRELRNVLERSLMLSDSGKISLSGSFGMEDRQEDWSFVVSFPSSKSIHDVTREVKRSLVLEALRRSGGAKQEAARLLGISRHAFAHQMKVVGLSDEEE